MRTIFRISTPQVESTRIELTIDDSSVDDRANKLAAREINVKNGFHLKWPIRGSTLTKFYTRLEWTSIE